MPNLHCAFSVTLSLFLDRKRAWKCIWEWKGAISLCVCLCLEYNQAPKLCDFVLQGLLIWVAVFRSLFAPFSLRFSANVYFMLHLIFLHMNLWIKRREIRDNFSNSFIFFLFYASTISSKPIIKYVPMLCKLCRCTNDIYVCNF